MVDEMTMSGNEDGFYETVFSSTDGAMEGASWRVARSLTQLTTECNVFAPHRSKVLDGTIGDASHAAHCSRHNPHNGIVYAKDFTHDPKGGFDSYLVAREIVKHPPKDLAYIISNRQIASRTGGWIWKKYTGADAHTNHMHVGVGVGSDCSPNPPCDDMDSWGLVHITPPKPTPKPTPGPTPKPAPFTRVLFISDASRNNPVKYPYMSDKDKGAKGEIAWVQKHFTDVKRYGVIKVDGILGPITEAAIIIFQGIVKLNNDGKVGHDTYVALANS